MNAKARILFVDDEKRVLNSMRGLFRREYELFLTTEGHEAVKLAVENEIDVIVADQRMPGMSGVEVLGKVKTLSPRTVRILLTGYADPAAVEGSINIGEVFRFLSKPCPPQLLRETLGLAIAAARTKPFAPTVRTAAAAQEPKNTAIPRRASPPPPANSTAASVTPQVHAQAPVARPGMVPLDKIPARPPLREMPPLVHRPRSPAVPIRDNENTEPALPVLEGSAVQDAGDDSTSHWMSVTNVVMSEDRTEETQENVAVSELDVSIADVGIVVFTVDSEFATTAIRAIGSNRSTTLATTLVKVAHAIEAQHAGVLVTDFTTNSALLQRMVGVLKEHVPQLATIVVSQQRDTTDMINLINYGQIFRYVLKPVEPLELRNAINAAAVHYLHLLGNPESVKRHQVIEAPNRGDTSLTLNRFMTMIRDHHARHDDSSDAVS